MLVNIFHSFHQLVDVIPSFDLVQSLSALNQVGERLILADVEHDVHVLLVFKVSVESTDVFVVERTMDFYFTGQLLSSFGSC